MFLKIFPDKLPSPWRLGILLSVLLFGSVALCIVVVRLALQRDLSHRATAVVRHDLGVCSALYRRERVEGMMKAFVIGSNRNQQGVRVTRPDGTILFEQMPRQLQEFRWPVEPPKAIREQFAVLKTLDHPTGRYHLLLGCTMLADRNILWFGRTDADDAEYIRHIQQYLWLAGLAASVFALLPMVWYIQHVQRPVRRMIASAKRLALGGADARLAAPQGVPELREFAEAFNKGLDQVAGLTSELQSANDQLAHELRTPLARIRGNLEIYHDHTDHPTARDALARGLDEIDRASQLVQTILTTRAAEHKALKLHIEVLDAGELVKLLYDLYLPAAEERSLDFTLDVLESRYVLMDRERIFQAVANLLDNAFAYSKEGGSVTLALELWPGSVRIAVRDTGPGMHSEEMERIWMRHIRGTASSARTPGMGLGLSLVRAIAHAHNGWADCINREEGGAEFWIELPGNQASAWEPAVNGWQVRRRPLAQ